jgi:biopolymer transport protein ExbD
MRRFSQRNALVTLSDINITPLLDLAFVLLIIFVITTPLLEQGLSLRLPSGEVQDNQKIDPKDVKTVEVSMQGQYMMAGKWLSLDQAASNLVAEHKRNPKMIVYIRAHEDGALKHVTAVLNRLELAGITQISIRTRNR